MNDYNSQNIETNGLADSARDLASHAEELLHNTAAISGEGIAALRNKLTESLRIAREQIGSAQSYAMDRGKQAVSATDSYVHEKPWQALAIAALFGVMIGFMSSSSRR